MSYLQGGNGAESAENPHIMRHNQQEANQAMLLKRSTGYLECITDGAQWPSDWWRPCLVGEGSQVQVRWTKILTPSRPWPLGQGQRSRLLLSFLWSLWESLGCLGSQYGVQRTVCKLSSLLPPILLLGTEEESPNFESCAFAHWIIVQGSWTLKSYLRAGEEYSSDWDLPRKLSDFWECWTGDSELRREGCHGAKDGKPDPETWSLIVLLQTLKIYHGNFLLSLKT